jgi:glycosyltransferase involved in cell wall biosynthesis
MRVAIVVPHFFPEFGGHEFYLAKAMAAQGADVHVITSDFLPPRYFSGRKRTPGEGSETTAGFELHRVRTYIDLHSMPAFDPRGTILRLKPDVVYATEFYQLSSALAYLAARDGGATFVFAQHMYEPPRGGWRFVWRGVTLTVGNQVAYGASKVIAISRAAKSLLVSLNVEEDKISVIPLGVDTDKFDFQGSGSELRQRLGLGGSRVLLYVGRLDEVKGVDVLLRAFAKIGATREDLRLLIIGSGRMEASLRGLASSLGIANNVVFQPWWPHERLPELYKACDVFVLPSLREAFGLVGLEAMSAGRPVVGSRVGGIQDYVIPGRTGMLAVPGDVDSLCASLSAVVDDGSLREEMGHNGRDRAVREYGYGTIARRSLEVFQSAMCTRAPRGRVTN